MFRRTGRKCFTGRVENVLLDGCREFARIFGDFGASGLSWATQLPALASFIQRNHMDQAKDKKTVSWQTLYKCILGDSIYSLYGSCSLWFDTPYSSSSIGQTCFFLSAKKSDWTRISPKLMVTTGFKQPLPIIIFITTTNVCIMIIVTQCL